eukprot:gene10584-14217_t
MVAGGYHLSFGATIHEDHHSIGIPQFPFVNHPFDVQIFLLDGLKQLMCGFDGLELQMKVYYENNLEEIVNSEKLCKIESNPSSMIIGKDGTTTVKICFLEASMHHANRKFVLKFSIVNNAHGYDIAPVVSVGMLSVKYRLIVKADLHDDTQSSVWYKDVGGRESCIDVAVKLIDANNQLVTTRVVPLKIGLYYTSGEAVAKQDLLVVQPESILSIDESGHANIKLRVNDVSKNHQRQHFYIRVCPDTATSPLLNDISADQTGAIEVKSKRAKKSTKDHSFNNISSNNNNSNNNNVIESSDTLLSLSHAALRLKQL